MAIIDTASGNISLFSKAAPVRPQMPIAEFRASFGEYAIHPFNAVQGLSPAGFSIVPHVVLEVSFVVTFFFDEERLSSISLVHMILPPRPTHLFGRLRYDWKRFCGTLIPQRSEAEEREWHRQMKGIHDRWIESALGTTAPLREWPHWGRILSLDTQGPMSPRILIEFYS